MTGGLFLVCIFVAALIGGFVGGCVATMFRRETPIRHQTELQDVGALVKRAREIADAARKYRNL